MLLLRNNDGNHRHVALKTVTFLKYLFYLLIFCILITHRLPNEIICLYTINKPEIDRLAEKSSVLIHLMD